MEKAGGRPTIQDQAHAAPGISNSPSPYLLTSPQNFFLINCIAVCAAQSRETQDVPLQGLPSATFTLPLIGLQREEEKMEKEKN